MQVCKSWSEVSLVFALIMINTIFTILTMMIILTLRSEVFQLCGLSALSTSVAPS